MIDQPLNVYTKQPNPALPPAMASMGMGSGAPATPPSDGGANMTFTPIKKKNNNKKIALIGGVLAFLILAVSGVWIAFRSGLTPVAPNAPVSQPGAATANTCSLNFTVAAPTYACDTACTTDAQCTGSLGAGYKCSTTQGNKCRLIANETSATCTPTTTTYACNTSCTTDAQCTGALGAGYKCSVAQGNKCRLTANETSATCTPTTTTYACNTACTTDTQCQNALGSGYKCSTAQGNTCRLTANETSATCSPATVTYACNTSCTTDAQCTNALGAGYKCSTSQGNKCRLIANESSDVCKVSYSCNSTCDNDSQCKDANADYVCSAAQGNKCRLGTNVSSTSCTPVTGTYACNSPCTTNEQCASSGHTDYICANVDGGQYCRLSTATSASNCQVPTPTPTPTIGCNQTCVSNSDCANPDHICYSNTCRLQSNPTNQYCAPSKTPVTPTPGVTPQPTLPTELPKSGAIDLNKLWPVGAGFLGIGALLLLFL